MKNQHEYITKITAFLNVMKMTPRGQLKGAVVYFFRSGVLFSIENTKFWPILANIGYFVANLRFLGHWASLILQTEFPRGQLVDRGTPHIENLCCTFSTRKFLGQNVLVRSFLAKILKIFPKSADDCEICAPRPSEEQSWRVLNEIFQRRCYLKYDLSPIPAPPMILHPN